MIMAHIYLNFSEKKASTQLFYLIYLVLLSHLLSYLLVVSLHSLGLDLANPSYFTLSLTLFFSQLFAFFSPALFWGFYYSPKSWQKNLSLHPLKKQDIHLLIISLLAIPASTIFTDINLSIVFAESFPQEIRQQILTTENDVHKLILPLFTALQPITYFSTILLVAVVPAICEELLFRAVLQKILIRLVGKPIFGIFLSAFAFAFFHGQFLGILPRFFLGIVLGLLFYRSRNILVPIIFHFSFNAIETITVFILGTERLKVPENLQNEWRSWILASICLALFIFFWQRQSQKK